MMVCCPNCQHWFDDFYGVCPKCKQSLYGEDAFNVPPPPPELMAGGGGSLPKAVVSPHNAAPDIYSDHSGETVPPPPANLTAGGSGDDYGRHGSVPPPPPQMRAGYEHIAPKQEIPPNTADINSPNYVPGYAAPTAGTTDSGTPSTAVPGSGSPYESGQSMPMQSQPSSSPASQQKSGSSKALIIGIIVIAVILLVIIALVVFVLVPGLFQKAVSLITDNSAASSQMSAVCPPVTDILIHRV